MGLKTLVGLGFYCSLALVIYMSGFLLYRPSHANKSTIAALIPRFSRAVIVVIDALRYDFLNWQENATEPFHNRLIFPDQLMRSEPRNCIRTKFVSDPPTTTMQRLKGLTTGSLPTFIDAGANFAGSAIDEDSWIYQANATKGARNLVLLGDDTWMALYPSEFDRVYAFPSFNTHDLHTVDNGILEHLDNELQRDDWWILIAHFLGVDHAGHWMGPQSIALSEKLTQMNAVIKNVSRYLRDDDLLLVFGDHGMTPTGDHGGDSALELAAGLFAYSKLGFRGDLVSSMPQIDIVPTLSALLGLPIPFSSLGVVNPAFFTENGDYVAALVANKRQILTYTQLHLENQPSEGGCHLRNLLLKLQSKEEVPDIEFVLREISTAFRNSWSKFNEYAMIAGLLLYAWGLYYYLATEIMRTSVKETRSLLRKLLSLLLTPLHYVRERWSPGYTAVETRNPVDSLILYFLLFLTIGTCSNSYLIYEDSTLRFMLATLLCFCALISVHADVRNTKRQKFELNIPRIRNYFLICAALAAVRFGELFNRCREEQQNCDGFSWLVAPANFLTSNLRFLRIVLAAVSLVTVTGGTFLVLRRWGNLLKETLLCLVVVPYAYGAMSVCIILHWLISAVPDHVLEGHENVKYVPSLLVLLIFALITTSWFQDPVMFIIHPRCSGMGEGDLNPNLRNNRELQAAVQELKGDPAEITVLDSNGIVTCYSAPYGTVLVAFCFFFSLMLGDGVTVSLLVMLGLTFYFLYLCENERLLVAGLFLVSQSFFYAFGHHAGFSYIPWEPAFLFCPPDYRSISLQAVLISLNVYTSQILTGLLLPLVAISGCRKGDGETPAAEFEKLLSRDAMTLDSQRHAAFYLLLCSFRMLGSMLASGLHRRHLMAWKIFAPKFLFDAVGLLISFLSVIIGQLLLWFLHWCLKLSISHLKLS